MSTNRLVVKDTVLVVPEKDIQTLKQVGCSVEEIFEAMAVTSLFNFMDRMADALGASEAGFQGMVAPMAGGSVCWPPAGGYGPARLEVDLKKAFAPAIGVVPSSRALAILEYVPQGDFLRGANGLIHGHALISSENPNLEISFYKDCRSASRIWFDGTPSGAKPFDR